MIIIENPRYGYRLSAAMIPPTIPRTIPAIKPPPTIRLKMANGNMMTSAKAPLLKIMMIDPIISVKPIMRPNAKAYVLPKIGSQKKRVDQNP